MGFLQIECHRIWKVSICQATRSFVCICVTFLQIECHHIWIVSTCQPTRSFVSICGGFLKIECHHILEVSICQPTMSFVRICMGFFQIECHAKGDVPEQLQMEANHIWCDWGMVCLTVLRYFDDMCRLFCFFLAAAEKVIYVNKCGIHSDRMLLTRMLEIFS